MVVSVCQAYIVVFLLLLLPDWKKQILLIMIVLSPFVLTYLLNIPFNRSGVRIRGYILFPSTIISIILTYQTLKNTSFKVLRGVQKSIEEYAGVIVLTFVICASFISGYYLYVYRDAPVNEMTYKMESGVFKGLYTTQEHGSALIHLEKEIQKITQPQDMVLFMDQAPHAYMMTHAAHATPSTWDLLQNMYIYDVIPRFIEGYDPNSGFIMHEYFRISGRVPNKIIFILDKERIDFISLWDEENKFTQYIKQNYVQTYSNNAKLFPVIMFEKVS